MTAKAEQVIPTLKAAGTNILKLEQALPAVYEGIADLVTRNASNEAAIAKLNALVIQEPVLKADKGS